MRYFLKYTKGWKKKIESEILLFRGGFGSCVQQIFNFFGLIDFLIRMTNIKYLLLKDTSC